MYARRFAESDAAIDESIRNLTAIVDRAQTEIQAALNNVNEACRKRRHVEIDVDNEVGGIVSGYDELSAVVARSEQRSKIRRLNRSYQSVIEHPTIYGLVNASKNGALRLSSAQIAELQRTETEDDSRIETARKVVDSHKAIKALLTRGKNKENKDFATKARASAELLEWTATHAATIIEQNEL